MAAIRVTSKNLGFMIALQSRFKVRYGRIFPHRWCWVRNRYAIVIPIDERASYMDYNNRAIVLTVARNSECYKFDMEVIDDDEEYERSYI